jgi:hypothetical protein
VPRSEMCTSCRYSGETNAPTVSIDKGALEK